MTGFVYAIAAGADRVKIGWSADPLRRLVKIRSDCPAAAVLVGVLPAARKQEAELQRLLKPWNVHGEWFERGAPVEMFLAMLPPMQPRQVDWSWKSRRADHPLARWIDARMTRVEFAQRVGIHPPHLSMILRRTRRPSLDLAAKISRMTDGQVPIIAFVDGSLESNAVADAAAGAVQ